MIGTGPATRNPAHPALVFSVLLLCTLAAGCAPFGGGGGASCGAFPPGVEAEPAQAAPTEPFRLRGEEFADHRSSPPGGPWSECPRDIPEEDIGIEFVQGDRTWALTSVDADEDFAFDAEGLMVPADAAPGPAAVRTTGGPHPPAEVPFLVLDPAAKEAIS